MVSQRWRRLSRRRSRILPFCQLSAIMTTRPQMHSSTFCQITNLGKIIIVNSLSIPHLDVSNSRKSTGFSPATKSILIDYGIYRISLSVPPRGVPSWGVTACVSSTFTVGVSSLFFFAAASFFPPESDFSSVLAPTSPFTSGPTSCGATSFWALKTRCVHLWSLRGWSQIWSLISKLPCDAVYIRLVVQWFCFPSLNCVLRSIVRLTEIKNFKNWSLIFHFLQKIGYGNEATLLK